MRWSGLYYLCHDDVRGIVGKEKKRGGVFSFPLCFCCCNLQMRRYHGYQGPYRKQNTQCKEEIGKSCFVVTLPQCQVFEVFSVEAPADVKKQEKRDNNKQKHKIRMCISSNYDEFWWVQISEGHMKEL